MMEENKDKALIVRKNKIQKWILVILTSGIAIYFLFDFVTGQSISSQGDRVIEPYRSEVIKDGYATGLIIQNPLYDYARTVRSGVYKMAVSGTSIDEIRFNRPEQLKLLKDTKLGVFHPEGGNVAYKKITENEILNKNYDGRWLFSGELAVPLIYKVENNSTPDDSAQLSEIIAFLPGLRKEVCQKINKQFGVEGVPKLLSDQSSFYKKEMIDDGTNNYVLPNTKQPYLNNEAFKGQPFGCFETYVGEEYVYYHVLFER